MKRNIFIILFLLILLTNCSMIDANIKSIESNNSVAVLEHTTHTLPTPFMIIPFVVLLLMIATGPLFYHHFWERHYPKVSIFLGSITILYYLFLLHDSISLIHTLTEYISFIALLSSLFVASGGILIRIDKKSTPMLNVAILFLGAIFSNIIGTTGASMLLIRPFLKVNKDRIKPYHIIFFIFIISNIGGALTPIGDPPLFLGFLRGVSFFWVISKVWYIWLPTIIILLSLFYFIDKRNYKTIVSEEDYSGKIEIKGFKNFIFLLIIIASVFIDPAIFPWVPSFAPLPFGIREIIMFTIVYLAYKFADEKNLIANEFDFEPIKEVAFLFIGIFACMIPALQLISYEAEIIGPKLNVGVFYWSTGTLSAFLDNAPTYLNFLSAEMGKFSMNVNSIVSVNNFTQSHPIYLQAISVAAVFFGAMTYIGNGPNFMVKSISERAGIKMPSFFAYLIKYSIVILLPIFIIIWLIFFNGA